MAFPTSRSPFFARGWAVVSIDYRVCPVDGVVMNGVISDAMDAGRYLAHFANELGIDARRIVTSGHSAGGHLALMMALAPHAGFAEDTPFQSVSAARYDRDTVYCL